MLLLWEEERNNFSVSVAQWHSYQKIPSFCANHLPTKNMIFELFSFFFSFIFFITNTLSFLFMFSAVISHLGAVAVKGAHNWTEPFEMGFVNYIITLMCHFPSFLSFFFFHLPIWQDKRMLPCCHFFFFYILSVRSSKISWFFLSYESMLPGANLSLFSQRILFFFSTLKLYPEHILNRYNFGSRTGTLKLNP